MIKSIKNSYERFVKIRGNPREIALGFALGLFVGMSPFMGLHTVIALFFAALLKWNKISAAIAVFITNPFSAPFIYSYTYILGKKFVYSDMVFHLPHEYTLTTFKQIIGTTPEIIAILTVGGLVSGIPISIIGYYLSFYAIKRYRKKHPKRELVEIEHLED